MKFFLIVFCVFCIFGLFSNVFGDIDERTIGRILNQTIKKFESQYEAYAVSKGAGRPNGKLVCMALGFYTKKIYTKGQLREMLISTAQELQDAVNKESKLFHLTDQGNFPISSVEIFIWNNTKDGGAVYDPDISVSILGKGLLWFKTDDPDIKYAYKQEFQESLEEALEIVAKSKSAEMAQ